MIQSQKTPKDCKMRQKQTSKRGKWLEWDSKQTIEEENTRNKPLFRNLGGVRAFPTQEPESKLILGELFYSELFNPQVSKESLIFYKNLGTLGVAIAALLCFLTNFYTASLVFANREIAPYWSLIGMQVKSAAIKKLLLHFLCLYQICHSGHRNSQAII